MARLIFEIDARSILDAIHVPTLVIHRRDYRFFPVEMGRYLAEHIADARLVEVPGADGFVYLGDTASILDPIEEFVTGGKRAPDFDRELATVLLTDIVGSTDLAAELGDHRWRELLDEHDTVIRRALEQYRGKLHRTTGDGILATFDGARAGDPLGLRDPEGAREVRAPRSRRPAHRRDRATRPGDRRDQRAYRRARARSPDATRCSARAR